MVSDVNVPYIDSSNATSGYDAEQIFGLIAQALQGRWPKSTKKNT